MGAFVYTSTVTTIVQILASIGGGCALWAAHEPLGWWPLVFVSLGLLWHITFQASPLRAFSLGFMWGLGFFLPHLDWAITASNSLLAMVALAVSQAVFSGLLGIVWAQLSHLSHTYAWIFAGFAWSGYEHLRGSLPFGGMPWGKIAFALNDSALVRLAPVGSTLLVGLVAAWISILLAYTVSNARSGPFVSVMSASLATMILVAPLMLPIGGKPLGTINVGIVQGNTPSKQEIPDGYERALRVTQQHADMAGQISGAELVVFPESTSDRDVRTDPEAGKIIRSTAAHAGVPILFGTQEYTQDGRYNDYLAMTPDGTITDRYSKQHPVPFGEYIPMRQFFSGMSDTVAAIVKQVSIDMLPGHKPAYIHVPYRGEALAIATPICFEVAYDAIVAEGVRGETAPAQLIVVPTNNASFGESGEPYQQFAMTRFRAIEHGRSAIQVSTTGTSGLVDSKGNVTYVSDIFVQDVRTVPVVLHNHLTLAARYSTFLEYLGYVCVAIGLGAAIAGWRAKLT